MIRSVFCTQVLIVPNYSFVDVGTHVQPTAPVNPDRKFGTVGAVACDVYGNIAAATSTGGMTNKRYSRVGDSPLIAAGTCSNAIRVCTHAQLGYC